MGKMIAAGLAIGLNLFPLGACAMAQTSIPPSIGNSENDRIGTVAMAADGTVTVTYDPTLPGPPTPPLTLRPGQKVYNSYVEMVGGLSPGESKPLYSYAGLVQMNEDRTLTVQWNGYNSPGLSIVEPERQTIKPGDPHYAEIMNRVGGLSPGQTKGIPKTAR